MKNVIVTVVAVVINELEVSIEMKRLSVHVIFIYIPLGHGSVGDIVITESLIRIPNK